MERTIDMSQGEIEKTLSMLYKTVSKGYKTLDEIRVFTDNDNNAFGDVALLLLFQPKLQDKLDLIRQLIRKLEPLIY